VTNIGVVVNQAAINRLEELQEIAPKHDKDSW
jgi:hypothetical protein